MDFIQRHYRDGSGTVYCFSKAECDKTPTKFNNAGISSAAYHAHLSSSIRETTQKKWVDNRKRVIVATSAFGMGIDKGDVRFVIHLTVPKSIEGYYNKCGRAGRDGNISCCLLFYSMQDSIKLMTLSQAQKENWH